MNLFNDDCLEKMKDIKNEEIDLLFCDLPYGQTSCRWDCEIDLNLFWKEVNRICKQNSPMIFTCSVRFGNTLINSNPKNFRYDLVWVKSASCGFLNAKKMPMKKHEMIYVFYRKLPTAYTENIALHHTHKFIKEEKGRNKNIYKEIKPCDLKEYEPPLPNSVIKENCKIVKRDNVTSLYGEEKNKYLIYDEEGKLRNGLRYEPPLPNSVIRDTSKYQNNSNLYGELDRPDFMRKKNESVYEPPLPNTILEMKSEKGKHSTQKPVTLMEWILKYYSRENDIVLDPTMGSGSMGVACNNLNRNFIGIEKDEKIFASAVERINNEM